MSWPGVGAHSIRRKLIGIVLATTFAALTLAGVALVIFDLKSYESSMSADLLTQAEIVGTATAPALAFQDEKVARENLSLLKASPTILAAAVYTAKGGLFATFEREGGNVGEDDGADGDGGPAFPQLPQAEGVSSDGEHVTTWRRIISNDEVLGTVPGEVDDGAWKAAPRPGPRCSASSRPAQAGRSTRPSGQRS